MITLFRKIRQRLVASGSITKYLFYATGEILLVVVGILIALQVNNWNEAKVNREYELRMLTEVKVALDNDIRFFSMDDQNIERSKRSMRLLIAYKNEEISRPDSLRKHLRNVDIKRFFVINDGPYEALKSSGMDKVSRDSVRIQMAYLYDFLVPATSYMLNEILQKYINDNQGLIEQIFGENARMTLGQNGEINYSYPEATLEQLQSKEFDLLLKNSLIILEQSENFLGETLEQAEILSGLIEDELDL